MPPDNSLLLKVLYVIDLCGMLSGICSFFLSLNCFCLINQRYTGKMFPQIALLKVVQDAYPEHSVVKPSSMWNILPFYGLDLRKGNRGHDASAKTPVFGILQRNGKVYTEIISNCTRATLWAIMRGKVL